MQDEKYQQKSKSISSAEPNYFVHFAMRHPVDKNVFSDCLFQNYVLMKSSLQNNLLWNFGVNLVLCEATL